MAPPPMMMNSASGRSFIIYPVSYRRRSADFPVPSHLRSHNGAGNRVTDCVRTMLRTGKSALRDLRLLYLRRMRSFTLQHWRFGGGGVLYFPCAPSPCQLVVGNSSTSEQSH